MKYNGKWYAHTLSDWGINPIKLNYGLPILKTDLTYRHKHKVKVIDQ